MLEITAPRDFSPFEEICTLTPFIERLSREFKDVACESCFKRVPNLKSCKACLDAKYCSKDCQKKDWKNHKLECQKLKNLPFDQGIVAANVIRLLGNTILKIKGKDWKSIKSSVLGMDVSFDDIDATQSCFPTYLHKFFYSSRKEYLRRYIGDENMPNDEDFKQLFGKVSNSLCAATIRELRVTTYKVFLESPLFEIKCIPNCYLVSRKNIAIIKAVKKIEKSEKLSLSTLSLFETDEISGISSLCNCTECRLPYGESVLSKVTDEQKALEVIIMTEQFIRTWEMCGTILRMPDTEYLVDDLLEKHEGVLGDTNALHLKLLGIKCFDIGSDPLEVRSYLLKLEKNVVAAFGENHPNAGRVYMALSQNLFLLGNVAEAILYLEKAIFLRKMFS